MKLTNKEHEMIQEFLSNRLSEDDRNLFDNSMKNIEFRDELHLQVSVLESIEKQNTVELRAKIKSFDLERLSEKVYEDIVKVKPVGKYLLFVTALIILAVLSYFLMNNNITESKNIELYTELYQKYPAVQDRRGVNSLELEAFSNAMDFYRSSKYDEALFLFEKIKSSSDTIELYKATSYLELEEFDQALERLDHIEFSEIKEIRQISQWYKLLLAIRNNDVIEIEKYKIKILSDPKHLFFAKVRGLD